MKTKLVVLVMLFVTAFTLAQKGDYSKYPGYVDLGDFDSIEKGDEVTEVLIEEHLLRMVSKMAKENEPELSDILSGIKLIKVYAFESDKSTFVQIKERAEKIDKELMSKDWDRIVKTRSRDEFANVYIKTENEDAIVGLVVASGEERGESAFVNIVGDINLETIGKLGAKFNIPSLGGIDTGDYNKRHKTEDQDY